MVHQLFTAILLHLISKRTCQIPISSDECYMSITISLHEFQFQLPNNTIRRKLTTVKCVSIFFSKMGIQLDSRR